MMTESEKRNLSKRARDGKRVKEEEERAGETEEGEQG
jgi:hypothetical protein